MAVSRRSDSGTLGKPKDPNQRIYDTMVIDDRVYKIYTTVVHQFKMGDVDDPDLYAAQPMWEWQDSEQGKWVMSKAVAPPEWHRYLDPMTYGYRYAIVAKLKDIDYTFWTLKWASTVPTAQ